MIVPDVSREYRGCSTVKYLLPLSPKIEVPASRLVMAHSLVENVIKQGYLKKGGSSASHRLSGFFRRNDGNKWFIFTIRRGVPFLEYYDNDVDVFTQQPINSFDLSNCQNVKSLGNSNPTAFCIVCPDRVIELIASSRTQMVGWVNEMEASLVHLGILHIDVADHVYTVCPAVVRKPRVKEVEDDQEAEVEKTTSATAVTTSDSEVSQPDSSTHGASGLPAHADDPPKPHVSFQRALSMKTSSESKTAPVRFLSAALNGDTFPPPLPTRPQGLKANTKRLLEHSVTSEEDCSIHPVTGSSNDSDFVSAEVIAHLRMIHQANFITDSLTESNSEEDPQDEVKTSHISAAYANEAYSGTDDRPNLSGSNFQPVPTSADESSDDNEIDSLTNLNKSEDEVLPVSNHSQEIEFRLSAMLNSVEVLENDYSALPVHSESSSGVHADSDSSIWISKPTPMPRKFTKMLNNREAECQSQVIEDNNTDLLETGGLAISDDTFVKILEEIEDNGDDGYTGLKQIIQDDETEKHLSSELQAPSSRNDKESHHTKDENENFYGLMYNNLPPPTTMAPPIPPLPPRNDSLPRNSDKSHATPAFTNLSLSHADFKTSSLFTSPLSSTSATSYVLSSHSRCKDDLTAAVAPPLPLPRKRGPNSDSKRTVMRSLSTDNDIPPMPPRRPVLQYSLTIEEKPPALPSRNSQSFFIKRPQITGLPISHRNVKDDFLYPAKDDFLYPAKETRPLSTDDSVENSASAPRGPSSGLSRKMQFDREHSLHTVVSLKLTQAEILQSEIGQPHVSVSLTQKSGHGLALVKWNNIACVVGWNQKDFASLHGKLHIGDLIFSVNNVKIDSPEMAQKLLKQTTSPTIDIMLHRMPHAKVFAIRRSAEGQSLGIKREGGTGEIIYVDPNGLAAQHGLTQHAPSAFGNTRCNWFLTEINNRPLNLFFKDNEIEHRLSAVGREISIVVQPSDFINEIRQQFKKIKNYKNYIVQ